MDPDTNDNELIKNLTGPLFGQQSRKGNVSSNDVIPEDCNTPIYYAITVNPQPTCKLNKKCYRSYTEDQQIAVLSRIEAALRRKHPDIQLVELRFEICPKLLQWHFHALYEMPPLYFTTVWAYYKRIMDTTDAKTKTAWRYIDLQPVYNKAGWEQYIRKDMKNQ